MSYTLDSNTQTKANQISWAKFPYDEPEWVLEDYLWQAEVQEHLRTASVWVILQFRDRILQEIQSQTGKNLLIWWNVLRKRHYSGLLMTATIPWSVDYAWLLVILQNMDTEWLIPWIAHINHETISRLGYINLWNWPEDIIRRIRGILSQDPSSAFILWIWWPTSRKSV